MMGRSKSRSKSPSEALLTPEERDSRTVVVMQLSQRVRGRDIEEFFSAVGRVRDVRLITCNKTRRFKGICYVEFKELESVPLALGLTGQKLLGVPVIVQPSQAEKNRMGGFNASTNPDTTRYAAYLQKERERGPTRLYIGSLHFNITQEMLRGIFEPFGSVQDIQLIMDEGTGRSKGYGFITFAEAADAKKALEQLNGFELAGRPMKVAYPTERTDGISSLADVTAIGPGGLDSDTLESGVELGATGRLALMAKLAKGTGMELPQQAAQALTMINQSQIASTKAQQQQPPAPQQQPNPEEQEQQQAQLAGTNPPIATQCFMLSNMFDPTTETGTGWDMEVRDDVIEECNKFGGVLHLLVDTVSPTGNVYVKCPNIATAVAAVNALHGRWFAGKVITAAYVPLVNYHNLFPDSMAATDLLQPSSGRQ